MFIYHERTSLLILISIFTANGSPLHCTFSFQKVTSFLKRTSSEIVEQQKYEAPSIKTLVVKNINGSISLVTKPSPDPACTEIFMQATKKAQTQELCQDMSICSLIDDTTLTLSTNDVPANHAGTVDYHLIVPTDITLIIETEKGNISTQDTHGMLTATTINGNIFCSNTHHIVTAHTKQSGSIRIEQAHKPVSAITKKGTIIIHDALDTITACTQKGKIVAHCAALPQQGRVHLKTDAGQIALHVPSVINASVSAQTTRGTVTSDHLITIQPHTTRLNAHAWNSFKKEVHGSLGTTTEPTSSIVLNSLNGNIKILDTINA